MFKVAILIEPIRSNCGGEWARGRRWFLYFVLIRVRYSLSPHPFPLYSCAFFEFYLFISVWGLSRFFRFRVFIRRVGCAVRGHCVLFVQPVCSSDICHRFLSGAFSLRVCVQGSRSLSGWRIAKCRHFCVNGYHFLVVGTGCEVDWVCVLVLGRQIMPSLVGGSCCSQRGVCGLQVVDSRGKFRCLIMQCALGDHLNSIVNSAVPVVGAFSRDMGPRFGGRI